MSAKIQTIRILQGTAPFVLARILAPDDGDRILQADLSAIVWSLFELDGELSVAIVDGATLTIADVIFDTLQTDSRWTKDSTGYNFKHQIPSANLATGGHTFRAEYKFTAGGESFRHAAEIVIVDMIS